MKAIHVNWTKPYFDKDRLLGNVHEMTRRIKSQTYDQPDYQIFYTMLSAIHWKLHNGPIKLYTDSIGLTFLQQFHAAELYDEIDINFLNGYSKTNIDAARFWTSGKVKCMAHQTKPFVFLDQDMIIRSRLPERLFKDDLTIAHWEIPRGNHYFDYEDWVRDVPTLKFPKNYNCNDWAPNTSFLVMNNLELLKKYTKWHKKLVEVKEDVPIWYWLLTDQGILGHVIRENDYKVNTLTDKIFLASHNYGTPETRYKGTAAPWYYPADGKVDKEKDSEFAWEHVWIEKIHYAEYQLYREEQTQRFFNEIVDLGHENKLHHPRFLKYWKEYEKRDNNN